MLVFSFSISPVNTAPILSPMKSYPAGLKWIASSQNRACAGSYGRASYRSKTWLQGKKTRRDQKTC